METCTIDPAHWLLASSLTPHPLGKLIEWKLFPTCQRARVFFLAPHSLGKLIEWKLILARLTTNCFVVISSPLAGETN